MCVSSSTCTPFFMALWERFYSSISSNIFSPKYSCLVGPPMDFWVNHKTFLIPLPLCASRSLLFQSMFYYFFYPALLQIKDAAASSHSTSVTIMCEDHDCISPEHMGHSPKKKMYFEILKMCPSDYYRCYR